MKHKANVGRPSRYEMEARNLLGLAKEIAGTVQPKKKERKRTLQLFVRFTAESGYDEVFPLMLALQRAGRGAQTKFVRDALIKAVREAKANA